MGLGAVLGEELMHKQGRVVNPAYLNYAMPRGRDLPAVRPILVEGHRDNGPYGAKSVGELPTCLAAPAVLNALYDATGIRFDSLPVTPDKVLAALRRPRRPASAAAPALAPPGSLADRPDASGLPARRALAPGPVRAQGRGRGTTGRGESFVATPETLAGDRWRPRPRRPLFGGGTDLNLQRRQGISRATDLVAIRQVAALRTPVVERDDGALEIGAAVTLQELLDHALVPQRAR